jgi:hypothetical protein
MAKNSPKIKFTYENSELFDTDNLFNIEGPLSITPVQSLSVDKEDPETVLYHFMGLSIYETESEGLSVCFNYPKKLLPESQAQQILADFIGIIRTGYKS